MSTQALSARSSALSVRPNVLARHPLGSYFVIAFTPVWLLLLPFVLTRTGLGIFDVTLPDWTFIVAFIGGTIAGPTAGALIVTAAVDGRAGVRRLLRRYVQWRVGLRWYALILLGYIVLQLGLAAAWLGLAPLRVFAAQWPTLFTSYLPLVLAMVLFPAIVEEPGWRGFALPRMQARFGPLLGTLLLGTLHGLWHLPVYMLVSGPAAMGPFSIATLASNTLAIVALSVIWSWVVNNANGSILIAILLHAASNASGKYIDGFVPVTTPEMAYSGIALYLGLAVVIIGLTRGRLGYRAPAVELHDGV